MWLARSNQETDAGKHALPCLTQKASYKGPSAESGEKHEPASDIDTVMVDSLKALDPNRPIREADIAEEHWDVRFVPKPNIATVIRSLRRPKKHLPQAAGTVPGAAHARFTKLRGPSALPQR